MKNSTLLLLLMLFALQQSIAQNSFPATGSVGIGTLTPNNSSITEMVSTSKGLLIPRMTKSQRDAIVSPATGLLIYQTNSNPAFYFFDGSGWKQVATGSGGANKTLSNLDEFTAINRSLIPKPSFAPSQIDLGDTINNWGKLFLFQGIFYGTERVFHVDQNRSSLYAGGNAGGSGFNNVGLGENALGNIFLGDDNTATGANALAANTSGDDNTATGNSAMRRNTTGSDNVAIGSSSLSNNISGAANIAIGINSLLSNIDGKKLVAIGDSSLFNQNGGPGRNTAIGSKTLFANTIGNDNTATGFNTLSSNTTGVNNAAFGSQALFSNTTGINNTANGTFALFSNTTGSGNTAVGISAGNANTTGSDNTAVGNHSFSLNTTGFKNTAVGSETLANNSTGDYNTAVGEFALVFNTTGNSNIGIGASALENNNSASGSVAIGTAALSNSNISRQVAIGDSALYNLNAGSGFNTAVGNKALFASTTGQENAAFGYISLQKATTGNFNAAFGTSSLTTNTTGSSNTGVGNNAISKSTTANDNTAVGSNSLFNTTTGGGNTAIGRSTLTTNTTGTNNTAIGNGANVSSGILTNATAIGNGASVDASNKIRFGNTAVTSIGGQVSYTTFSDGRFKQNIKDETHGLDFINKLKPVSYNYDVNSIDNFWGIKESKEDAGNNEKQKAKAAQAKKRYTGFLAQDVDKAAQSLNYEFSGIDKPEDDSKSTWGLRYSDFVVPLVKAVQELSDENDELKKQNNYLQQQIEEIKRMVTENSNITLTNTATQQAIAGNTAAMLSQNIPNPFNNYTVIKYELPQQAKQAVINITAADGKIVKSVTLITKGNGQLNLQTSELAAGTYRYSLIVDGKLINTKTMVLMK